MSTYDIEKQRLVAIARSKANEYNGPVEDFENIQVIIDESKKKLVISYTLVKGKRTIKQTFSYNGTKYKIYNDWEITRLPKKYTTLITEEFLNNLENDTTPIICKAKKEILMQLPLRLKTKEMIAAEIKLKYKNKLYMQIQAETRGERETICLLTSQYEKLYSQYTSIKETKETAFAHYQEIGEEIENILQKFFLFKTKQKRIVSQKQEELDKYSVLLTEYESTIDYLTAEIKNISKEKALCESIINEKTKKITESIEQERNQEFIHLLQAKEKEEEQERKKSLSISSGTPSIEWQKEERAKLQRIFQNGLTLREWILQRDNYTCRQCGNSIKFEPNLLLEVDHICPVSKWGPSMPENLQTLCWKCNRAKSNKN